MYRIIYRYLIIITNRIAKYLTKLNIRFQKFQSSIIKKKKMF